jgi:two-component system chemotaxis response regulator CheY
MEKFHVSTVRALVIDDDAPSRTLLARLLMTMGAATVQEADNGGDGLRLAFSEPFPHLIISDLHMDPVDGLSVLGAVRSSINSRIAAIPVIIFTAATDETLMRRAMQEGATSAIPKPFNPQGLSELLRHVVKEQVRNHN